MVHGGENHEPAASMEELTGAWRIDLRWWTSTKERWRDSPRASNRAMARWLRPSDGQRSFGEARSVGSGAGAEKERNRRRL